MKIEKIKNIANKSELFFFVGFIPYLIRLYMETTAFPQILSGKLGVLFTLFCAGLMLVKIIFCDRPVKGELVADIAMLAVGVLSYVGCDNIEPIMLVQIIISAKGIDFDKILKVWLIISVSVLVAAFLASQIGWIPDWTYHNVDRLSGVVFLRHSYGMGYFTDFSAHVFFTVLTALYLRRDKLKIYEYLLAIIVGVLVYFGTKAKLDTACIIGATILFAIANGINKCRNEKIGKTLSDIWSVIGILAVPIMAVLMIVLTNSYVSGGALEGLNEILNKRLEFGKSGLEEYGVKLIGQFVEMYGAGGGEANAKWDLYNFIDSSYINILIVNGLLFFIMLMVIYLIIAIKNRKNVYMMAVFMLLAVNCFVAHHMIEIEYNIFTAALMAVVTTKTKEKEITELVKQTE